MRTLKTLGFVSPQYDMCSSISDIVRKQAPVLLRPQGVWSDALRA